VIVLNGTVGARLHISFPVLSRSSFGFWLSYFALVSRVVLSMFWFGVQCFIGSECVYQVRDHTMEERDANIRSDAQGDLAIPSAPSEPSQCILKYHDIRNDVLCYLLVHIVPFSPCVAAPDSLAFRCESIDRAPNLARNADLGLRSSTSKQRNYRGACDNPWICLVLGLAIRPEFCPRYIRHTRSKHT